MSIVPRVRRMAVLVLAALVGLGGVLVLLAGSAAAAVGDGSDVTIARYGGADRYATSLLVAKAVAADAGGSLSSVVLVSGERWTDAVVAAPVAGALGAPVLMTPPGELRSDALEFLQRVGVTDAVVIGPDVSGATQGPGRAVSAAVIDALADAGMTAERITGSNRYSTGVAAAGQVKPGVMPGLGRTAIVASGEVFADALVAGPFAALGTHPVLLSPPDQLHPDVARYLNTAGIDHVAVMGGTAALSAAVETAITELGASVTRLAGKTRYDTAAKAAELVADRYSTVAGRPCFATSTIGLARARVPFDSFSAAPLLARLCAPLVLADPQQIPADTATYLDAARATNATVGLRVFGGDAAVSQSALDAYLAAVASVAGHDACRPPSLSDVSTTVGFPLPETADPSSGRVKITVLFMDFPDAQATHTTHEEIESGLPLMEEYLEAQSYGRLDIGIDVVHRWYRSLLSYRTYLADDAAGATGLWPSAGAESVRLADDAYDFSDTDIVLTVFPSDHFGRGLAHGSAFADRTALSGMRINTHPGTSAGVPWNWGLTAAHELAHNFGLVDLYPYDANVFDAGDPPEGSAWVFVELGLMGLKARYPDPDYTLWFAASVEMLAWTRWQLGWLEPAQVACGVRSGTEVRLEPVAQPGTGTVMAVVPLNEYEMIVIENRRRLGFDATTPVTHQSGAPPRHGLLEEGVLVYTVDSRVHNGQLSITIAGAGSDSRTDGFPMLTPDEAVTMRGHTVTVTGENANTYTVTVTKAN
ncbi:cell wall-binding repeat-containing protein [Candidatus Poriferisodalis sp.]|uniref:cell wall-binding repeat-containing protein n=1 Tax=Candidatus Poriferisodalis sp. TaxID=3101277 RepID=UPI003C6F127A